MTPRAERAATRVLVTGFGPFPGVHDNPSARLVDWLGRDEVRGRRAGVVLETALLPVGWRALPDLAAECLARSDPDIALHFGCHSGAAGFAIEAWARNRKGSLADANGEGSEGSEVVPGAPHRLPSAGSATRLAAHLAGRGLPAAPSADAGRYLCNMLFYLSLHRRQRTGRPSRVHFIHIPALVDCPGNAARTPLSRAALQAGVGAIISYNVAQARAARNERNVA